MQVASWLLVQRALKEGEMKSNEARQEKYRLVPESHKEEGLSFSEIAKDAYSPVSYTHLTLPTIYSV